MNLQQLRYVLEVARSDLNVSHAAESLFTSQPGVSKQIRLLEEELGVVIFERHGKRLVGVTEPGKQVLTIAERLLGEVDNLKRVGEDFSNESAGSLSIATTARLCQQRADYVVPCSTQSQFPDLWSAPLRRAHWMPTLGDPGAHAVGAAEGCGPQVRELGLRDRKS